mgnify:CR=1 FL=1
MTKYFLQNANNVIEAVKQKLGLRSDNQFVALLGIAQSTLSTWRKRNTLDYPKIIQTCIDFSIDLNEIFITTVNEKIMTEDFTIENIKFLMQELNYSERTFCEELDIEKEDWKDVINGNVRLNYNQLLQLSSKIRVPVNDIVTTQFVKNLNYRVPTEIIDEEKYLKLFHGKPRLQKVQIDEMNKRISREILISYEFPQKYLEQNDKIEKRAS